MSAPLWMLWRPLGLLGEAITHIATVVAWIAVVAGLFVFCIHLCIQLCIHLLGPTRQTALRGWIMWRLHRRTARRFACAVTTGDPETAEVHARQLLAPTHPRHVA